MFHDLMLHGGLVASRRARLPPPPEPTYRQTLPGWQGDTTAVASRISSITGAVQTYRFRRFARLRPCFRNENLKNVSSLVVFHNLNGRPYSKSGVETAWVRACERQGIENAWFRDLRPKALSDAKRAGVTLRVISESAGHSSLDTTADYIRGFEARKSALGLTFPKSKKAG